MKKLLIILAAVLTSCTAYPQLLGKKSPYVWFPTVSHPPTAPIKGAITFFCRDTLWAIDSTNTLYPLTKLSGGSPAGSTGHVQFNTAGAFDSDTSFYYDKSTKWLWIPTVVSTDLYAAYVSSSRIEGDSLQLTSHINLGYIADHPAVPAFHGQFWVKSADERPYFTNDGGITKKILLDGDAATGTITSISAGNGMNFTTITGSGAVTLGTPSTLTASTTNAATTSTHTHAITGFLPLTGGTLTGRLTAATGTASTNGISFGNSTEVFSDALNVLNYDANTHNFLSATGGTNLFSIAVGGVNIPTGYYYQINGYTIIDNTAFDYTWDGITTIAPSKNAVYDAISALGTSVVQVANLSLSSAQILALNSTPVQIIAAPGAGKEVEIMSATMQMTCGTSGYSSGNYLDIGRSGLPQFQFFIGWESGTSTSHNYRGYPAASQDGIYPNTATYVFVESANPTGGNGTAKIYVTYRIITL